MELRMDSPAAADISSLPVRDTSPGVLSRSIAIFTRPAKAWDGLADHVQWWFPVVCVSLAAAVVAWVLHDRAVVPMLQDTWRDQVANGQMTAEQFHKMDEFFSGPQGMIVSVAQQFVILPIVILLTALVMWFGIGFILGRPTSYRMALEVVAWSSLITIPAQFVTAALAWNRETMKGVHVGFGLLLPDTDTPSRLGVWLGAVLDALGPLSIWYVVVLVLGAAAVSGAPRRSVAWVIGSLYVLLVLLFATLGALFAPVS